VVDRRLVDGSTFGEVGHTLRFEPCKRTVVHEYERRAHDPFLPHLSTPLPRDRAPGCLEARGELRAQPACGCGGEEDRAWKDERVHCGS
jgi:hypothetical protein